MSTFRVFSKIQG